MTETAERIHLPGRPDAERLLRAALVTPAHAYGFVGPRGSGQDDAAVAFISALLDADPRRIRDETHPDLYVVEPEGEAILIDQVRALRTDLHLRPFEAARRAYLLRGVETLGPEAANALLKSLEEPPPYAVFVLICHDRARLLPTIESRLQTIRFRRLPAAAVRAELAEWAILPDETLDLVVRASLGNPERARRLAGSEAARDRHRRVLEIASAPVRERGFDVAAAAAEIGAAARARGDEAEAEVAQRRDALLARLGDDKGAQRERRRVERLHDELAKRRRRRAETDELREAVDVITSYWRDVLCVAVGAEDAVVSSDRLVELREVARTAGQTGAEAAVLAARDVRRSLELPVIPSLALEGLLHAIGLAAGEASHR